MNYSSADCGYLLLGPYNLLGVSDKLETEHSKPVVDTTPLGVEDRQYEPPGVAEHVISGHSGWYDDDEASINAAMCDLASGEHVFMFAHEGNAKGKYAMCAGGAIKANFKASPSVGDFVRATMELAVSGHMEHAVIVKALEAVSGNGSTEADYLDLGAGTDTGCNVYLSCTDLELDGGSALTVKLRDSTDHLSWADHTTMTALTEAGAEKVVATDLTVNRYLAASHAFTGGSAPTATYTLAVKTNAPST
jgi:hypothetical protein